MSSGRNSAFVRSPSEGNGLGRRHFLADVAAVGGAAALSAVATNPTVADELAQAPRPSADSTTSATTGSRGKVQDVRSEIKEYKDPGTGGRVRRLTGDGSSNIHPYFTSSAFVGDDADSAVFLSNRSGAYQWHLLKISAARLVQLTAGPKLSANMACLARSGRLFYFDDQVLRSVHTDTLEDRELHRVPPGYRRMALR
jgi:hypothetical protein